MSKKRIPLQLSKIANWPQLAEEVHYQSALLATRWEISTRKLQREFRRQLNTTPQRHLNGLRALAIKEMVSQRRRTKKIRVRLGFKYDFQVSRNFASVFGTSLKAFRRRGS